MKKLKFVCMITLIAMTSQLANSQDIPKYPDTKKVDTVDVYYGVEVPDPYRWLEDDRSKETQAWVKDQNKVTDKYLDQIKFRDELNERLTEVWNYPKYGVPFRKGGYIFFFKNDGLQDQSVLYIQEDLDAEAEVLLDPNTFSEDGTVALSQISVSNDGKYLGYSIARGGSDWNEIYVMDIQSRELFDDHIKWVKFSDISWKGDGFYYSAYGAPDKGEELTERNEFHKIYYHKLGTDQSEDRLIFEDKENPLRNFYAQVTEDERFMFVYESQSSSGNALYFKKLDGQNDFVQIIEGFEKQYSVLTNLDDRIFVRTNYNAPRYKLMEFHADKPRLEYWEVVLPEKDEVLQAVEIMDGKIIAEYMKDAYSQAFVYDGQGNFLHEMKLPGIGTLYSMNGEKDKSTGFFGFTSFTYPSTAFIYDVEKNESKVYRKPEIKGINPDEYVTEQIFFKSKDGTKVPMFLVHKEGIKLDGNNPVLLYGYGGFNISLTPSFSLTRLMFIEQGGIYAQVNLRGGGEYGEEWHQAGTKMNKQNVFNDFIAATETLIDKKFTNPSKIAIMGGSNGGLLVGAVMTQRPELFAVAIPQVGVMDMLRYHLFTIGWAWAGDYGTSEESEEMFRYIFGYSPIHNIERGGNYPATLVTTADHDDRVVPAHSFKFIATLQEKGGDNNPYLIMIETKAGHGSGKPTSKVIEEYANIYSFIMYNLGMKPEFLEIQ
ncbi:MAG: prolyl oligopeptidase family serine peptidase [Bacteroidales bacterium]|nr:prolyl oligopeptidase family serine peptidase [Bacteroidales bacterium]MCF8345385.1 prolyl oligopeptidase family serine peptidase [Bacteroidales bacterium]MCF8352491.1 prolyl oligopeptidase family serine peptidase [Bacteroidales bacterium]MCF8375430.1 prolyl oligopeptidase family serine peptidase [Bacteroidales bacterium]MCF8400978.1 prolyl oligopeptidase family serine peptidase [Bacteroidales bacterium]